MSSNPYNLLGKVASTPGSNYVSYIQSQQQQGPPNPRPGSGDRKQLNAINNQLGAPQGPPVPGVGSSIDPWMGQPSGMGSSIDPWMTGSMTNQTSTMGSGSSPLDAQARIAATGASTGGAGGATGENIIDKLVDVVSGDTDYGSGGAKTEFGKSFTPQSYNDLWSNPEVIIQEWLNQRGAPTNTGGGAQTLNLADRMGIMWMLMNNDAFGNGADPDIGAFLDWSDGYVGNMRTPGGAMANSNEILSQIMSPGENTPLYYNMYNSDMRPEDQINAALSTMRYGLQGVSPALMIQAMMSRAQELGRQYQADVATGRDQDGDYEHFGDYLAQNRLMG